MKKKILIILALAFVLMPFCEAKYIYDDTTGNIVNETYNTDGSANYSDVSRDVFFGSIKENLSSKDRSSLTTGEQIFLDTYDGNLNSVNADVLRDVVSTHNPDLSTDDINNIIGAEGDTNPNGVNNGGANDPNGAGGNSPNSDDQGNGTPANDPNQKNGANACEGDNCANSPENKDIELNVALPTKDGGSSKAIAIEGGAVGIMKEYVGRVYLFGTGLVVVVAVIMLIVGGIEIMVVGGIASTDSGKQRITQALLGIVLVALSALILNWINPSFFQL